MAGTRFEFQSTRPRGARLARVSARVAGRQFQSTRPRGARPRRPRSTCATCPFQSTRPRGARLDRARGRSSCRSVSIHAPARGATRRWCAARTCRSSFNPRARAGRDTPRRLMVVLSRRFQSTRPRGARRMHARCPRHSLQSMFQSTRPRGARRPDGRDVCDDRVSIHAPARGATDTRARRLATGIVSIHAPARGATCARRALPALVGFNPRARAGRDRRVRCRMVASRYVFQSTRPRGARLGCAVACLRQVRVSIHAPARGATDDGTASTGGRVRFNPRARAGRDRDAACRCSIVRCMFQSTRPRGARRQLPSTSAMRACIEFQSTRPRGARRATDRAIAIMSRCFNPRARAGRDARVCMRQR